MGLKILSFLFRLDEKLPCKKNIEKANYGILTYMLP